MIPQKLLILSFVASLTALNALKDGVPRFTTKNRGSYVAPGKLHRRLHNPKRPTHSQTTPTPERALLVPKHSANSVPRNLIAAAKSIGNAPPPIPAEELETLAALYHSLSGPNWHIKDGWMSASNPCGSNSSGGINNTWYGVECTAFESAPGVNASSHVVGIVLPQNNLVGKLQSLHNLKHVHNVDFSNPESSDVFEFQNSVGGTLDSFCGLGNLFKVLLAGNNITGSIPGCIQSLANATVLDLAFNAIQGTTPDDICRLRNLEELLLRGNRLEGSVPECIGEELTALRVLDYSNINADYSFGNQYLSGTLPVSLCYLEHLESLSFQCTQGLEGTIPYCLGAKQPQLQFLELQVNQFHGPLPEELCRMSALEYLLLNENALTGTLPNCLGSLNLAWMFLDFNQFNGTVPSCLGSLSQLSSLALDYNQFSGPIPHELCQASALEYLYLSENVLTGAVPSCLGSLNRLICFDLQNNQFSGPIPEELCQASGVELLFLNSNALTGSIPSCLATSLPYLQCLLLYNNYLTGALPSKWTLPSLVSIMRIMLSNNPMLSGSLSSSLFLQNSASNATDCSPIFNVVLRAVVIDGTSIGGSLPTALCLTPELAFLALSGNKLTGSLPNCITTLKKLQTLRISDNHLTGTLPIDISNMTSLTVLDLNTNEIEGRVPAALGDISQNLDTMQLQLNRLSCDLPTSVLNWQVSSSNISFNLLNGNYFGCGTNSIFALSIQGAAGLRNADAENFDAYSCGNSNYVVPGIAIVVLAMPVIFGLIFMFCRGRLALQWHIALEWLVNPSTLINELDHADKQLKVLSLQVMAAAILVGGFALLLSLNAAKSAFDCEYMATSTIGYKGRSDVRLLSIGIGAAVSIGLLLGTAFWWHRLVVKCSRSTDDYGASVAYKRKPLQPIDEEAEAWDFDADRMAEAIYRKPTASSFENIKRAFKLVGLITFLVILTIGPNVGYVYVVERNLTQQQKVASELAVTLAKTAIGTLLVPRVARKAVDLIVLNGALTFARFRLRMGIATAFSAITMIMIPLSIVLMTDKQCLNNIFMPQPAVDTDVPYLYCLNEDLTTGACLEYASVSSTYTPNFAYDGEICVSAILSVYGPVFLGVVLLAATIPAGTEAIIVPLLAPWCYRKSDSSLVARTGLAFLRAMTWNVWPTLAHASVLPPNFSLGAAKIDYLAQRVVERAFVQVLLTLLVALTFGIAVPLVGFSCAMAAFVQYLHHRHVFGQIVGLGRLEQPVVVPNLMGCTDVPIGCAVVVIVTVVLVWVCGTVGYLEPAVIGCMLLIGLSIGLAAAAVAAWWRRNHTKIPRHQDQAQSIAPSDTSRDMLMEKLLFVDSIDEDSGSC